MATVSKEQEQAIKRYLKDPKNFIEYEGVKIVDNTEFSKFIAKIFNLPDNVSDKPGMNKVGYLKKQNAELFDGYEIRKGNIFKRDKPLIQALNNDPVFKDEINKKLKALNKKDFFDLTKDQQNTIVKTTKKVKRYLKVLPKNFLTRNNLAEKLKLSIPTLEAYQGGKLGKIGDKFREIFKPIVLKNKGTFFDSTNLDNKLKKFNEFTDRPILHKTSIARANLLASDPEIQNLLEAKDKSLFNTDEGLKKALKVLGKGSTPHEAAHAITVLARAYNGEKFRGLDIKSNKTKGKFIINNIAKLQYDNPWTTGLYDEGLRQVDRDLGNKVNTFKNFKVEYRTKLQNLLKEYGIKEKFNINEITSVKASANNKIAPYAAFVDLTQADINQKALSGFQGDLSKTLSYIDRNKNNQAKILEKIEKFNTGTRKKRINNLIKDFGEGAKDVRFAEIIPGTNVESIYAKGDLDRWKTKGLDLQKLADEKGYFLDVKGARPYFDVTPDDLKKSVQGLIKDTEDLPKNKQILLCNFLSNGGLPGDCKRAIAQDPEKAAQIISKVPADTKETAVVKDSAQKLIRLFRGEPFKPRNKESIKALAKRFNVSEAEASKRVLGGQFFSANPDLAKGYTGNTFMDNFGKTKYVDLTPKEFQDTKRYVERINKTNDVGGGTRFPVSRRNDGNNIQIMPRRKLKQLEDTGRMKSKMTMFGNVDTPPGTLKYDSVVGGFIDPADPTKIVDQAQITAWAQENPMPVRVGEEPLKVATNKSVLKNVGRTLATIGAPLPTALLDGYFINEQVKEGKGTAEIASNPLNWLGLATMSTLSDISGVSKPGKLNAALRLGLNPAAIRGISRFAGLPGLAVSTAMTAYDQYKKYQNEEGFIYNLFNKEEK